MNRFLIFLSLTLGLLMAGCGKDSDGDGGPKAGQTSYSIELSGGQLTETLKFEGVMDKSPNFFSSSTSILGTGLDQQASNGTAVLQQFLLGPNSAESREYDPDEADFTADFWFPDDGVGYQLHGNENGGTITMTREGDQRVVFDLDFDASPSNIGGRDLVFHVVGTIDGRARR